MTNRSPYTVSSRFGTSAWAIVEQKQRQKISACPYFLSLFLFIHLSKWTVKGVMLTLLPAIKGEML